jgi:hypothetical protein
MSKTPRIGYIITAHRFYHHRTFKKAAGECERLAKKHTDKVFRILPVIECEGPVTAEVLEGLKAEEAGTE